MAVDGFELPEPAKYNPADEVKTDPEHGLYEFFYDKEKALLDPDAEAQHGRSWTVEELRHKSWDDLHKLWWVCVKERNRIATASRERTRLKFKTGEEESKARMRVVRFQKKIGRQANIIVMWNLANFPLFSPLTGVQDDEVYQARPH